jgi:orotate phosphoribosyltransferase
MTPDEVLKTYEETGALLTGHFLLSSGRHSDRYLQSALVLQWPPRAERMAAALADKMRSLKPQAVVSPALGGLFVGQELARALGVRHIFTEREKGSDAMGLRRGFQVSQGERIVAVEDIVTTGKSVGESIAVVRGLGAEPVGVGCLIDRSGGAVKFGLPLLSLASLKVESWEEKDCPLCKRGEAVIKPGSRKKF